MNISGIIAYMDEECLRPGDPTDMTLLEKMNKNLSHHKHYISHEKADIKLQKIMGRNVSVYKIYKCMRTCNAESEISIKVAW